MFAAKGPESTAAERGHGAAEPRRSVAAEPRAGVATETLEPRRRGSEAAPAAPTPTRDAGRHERLGALAASGGAILFGTSYVATAFVLRSFTPLSTTFWRGALGAIVMVAYLAVSSAARRWPAGGRSPADALRHAASWPALWRIVALGVLAGPLFTLGMNVAVGLSGAAIASFVAGLYSVLGAIFGTFLLRERLRLAALAGFGVSIVGTLLLTGYQPGGSLAGVAAGLFAAVTFALYLVLGRRWSAPWGLDPRLVTLTALVLSAICLVAIEAIHEPNAIVPANVRLDALLGLAYLVLMVSFVAALLVLVSVSMLPASRSAAFLLLNPPSAAIAAWILLGESFNAVQLLGALLVLAGIAMATIQRRTTS